MYKMYSVACSRMNYQRECPFPVRLPQNLLRGYDGTEPIQVAVGKLLLLQVLLQGDPFLHLSLTLMRPSAGIGMYNMKEIMVNLKVRHAMMIIPLLI